jgi:hypothetical protein
VPEQQHPPCVTRVIQPGRNTVTLDPLLAHAPTLRQMIDVSLARVRLQTAP